MKKLLCCLLIISILFSLTACGSDSENSSVELVAETLETVEETIPVTVETEESTEATVETEPETEPVEVTEPETIPEPEPEAVHISDGVCVYINDSDKTYKLSDEDVYSRLEIDYDDVLALESEQPFAALYIEWWELPQAYTIAWEGGSMSCGEEGFAHDYIRLPESVTRVEFVFSEDNECTLSNIEAYTDGTAPAGVQDWQLPCEEADILVFPTHSDDDVLFFGPVMAYYAIEAGLKVQTAFMVDHTETPVRVHERLNGLWDLGIRYYPIVGSAPDTGTRSMYEATIWYGDSDILGWQIEQIRRFQPLVILGHDLNGEYGNGGHKVNAHFLVQAIEAANDPEQYPESAALYGVWNTPKLYLHLYEENEWYFDVDTPLENDPEGRSPFQIATVALTNHKSQHGIRVQYGEVRSMDCRPFGLYRTLVGYDTMADVMENIDPAQWRQETE